MDLNSEKVKFQSAIDFLVKELSTIRTGRASTSLVEDIKVDAYGSLMPLKSCGNISIPEARQILIDPWDKSLIKEIEKAIMASNIGLNPNSDGSVLRINLPEMTEDKRKDLLKIVGVKCENCRIEIRKIREELKNSMKDEKDEDLKKSILEDLDSVTKEFNEKVEEIRKKKEEEVMTV